MRVLSAFGEATLALILILACFSSSSGLDHGERVLDTRILETEDDTSAPTISSSPGPSASPITPKPTEVPTEAPTEVPTELPTEEPTEEPTVSPTEASSPAPTVTMSLLEAIEGDPAAMMSFLVPLASIAFLVLATRRWRQMADRKKREVPDEITVPVKGSKSMVGVELIDVSSWDKKWKPEGDTVVRAPTEDTSDISTDYVQMKY